MTTIILTALGFLATFTVSVFSSMIANWLYDWWKNRRSQGSNSNPGRP